MVRIDAERRQVVLGRREELARDALTAADANWLTDPPATPFSCTAQIRYNHRGAAAVAEALPGGRFRVEFAEPVYGVAPGQAVVLYQDDRVLGGGWIEEGGAEQQVACSTG